MGEVARADLDAVPVSVGRRLDDVCRRFEAAWQATRPAAPPPLIEDYLNMAAEPERSALLLELILVEVHYRRRRGEVPDLEEYQCRFPHGPNRLAHYFEAYYTRPASPPPRTPSDEPSTARTPENAANHPNVSGYQVLGVLGRGGMAV